MCYKFGLMKKQMELKFKLQDFDDDIFGEYFGFDHPFTPILTNERPTFIELAQWGLVPPNKAADPKAFWKHTNTLNARIEYAKETSSYKGFLSNRCLVLATEFYEKKKRIYMPGDTVFAMAGIYTQLGNHKTYSIMTTSPNQMMAKIHERMPVVLQYDEWASWLQMDPLELFYDREGVELLEEPKDAGTGQISLF